MPLLAARGGKLSQQNFRPPSRPHRHPRRSTRRGIQGTQQHRARRTLRRDRVIAARKIQLQRFAASRKCRANAEMSHGLLKTHCLLDAQGQELLRHALEELHLSARAYDRILKLSRTIADPAEAERIEPVHVMEATQYRTLDRSLGH